MSGKGEGLFALWQPQYAALGIATFPVKGKKPMVRGYRKVGAEASRQLAEKHGQADALGILLKPAGIVVVDIDDNDERLLAEALDRHGPTPFVVRSGRGNFQAWYRRTNEGRLIRPDPALPIDILGDGFVVAPPSIGTRGRYEIIAGELADLRKLPCLLNGPPGRTAAEHAAAQGHRNDTLWHRCMEQARHCDDLDALMDVARTLNAGFQPPLDEAEVAKVAGSVWGYTERGSNWFGRGRVVAATHDEVDKVLHESPDAFILLTVLRRHHWGREFVVANAMADHMPGGGWTRKRLADARSQLEEFGLIDMVRPAGRRIGPAVYRLKGGQI